MKNIFITFFLLLGLSIRVYGQTDDYVAPKLLMSKGKTVISLYTGYNTLKILHAFDLYSPKAADAGGYEYYVESDDIETKAPFGLSAEYMLTDRFSLGIDFTKSSSTYKFKIEESVYDPISFNYTYYTYSYTSTVKSTKILLRPTWHLSGYTHYDAYFFMGVGYKGYKQETTTNDPTPAELSYPLQNVPIGFKPGFGVRLMPIDNLGIQFEMAVSNPCISIGIVGAF